MPTDNTVVAAFESLLQVAEARSVPLVTADGESVERGAIATYGGDYEQLGYRTGEMAVEILQAGADPAEMPAETSDELLLTVNPAAAGRLAGQMPAPLLDRAGV